MSKIFIQTAKYNLAYLRCCSVDFIFILNVAFQVLKYSSRDRFRTNFLYLTTFSLTLIIYFSLLSFRVFLFQMERCQGELTTKRQGGIGMRILTPAWLVCTRVLVFCVIVNDNLISWCSALETALIQNRGLRLGIRKARWLRVMWRIENHWRASLPFQTYCKSKNSNSKFTILVSILPEFMFAAYKVISVWNSLVYFTHIFYTRQ